MILDLCAGSGAWSQPYVDAGYDVRRVTWPEDVRLLKWGGDRVHGILAAPPCTVFASSGARWGRSDDDYIKALSVVDACLRAVLIYAPKWWALENPIGKLRRWLGPPPYYFQPCWFGHPHTKRTALWGRFTPPRKGPCVSPAAKNPIHHMPPSDERAALRAITPAGFARAFFEANP